MGLKNFLLSKLFLKQLVLAFLFLAATVILLLISLNFYTRHGQARPVPDFMGLDIKQAEQLARKNKLRYGIIDSVYTTTVPRGSIADQNPKPGFRVKKWRNISLTINAFNPEMVAMPNLIDLPKRQALALIESAGLSMGELRYIPDLSVDVVLQQLYNGRNVAGGDSLQKGSVIDLVLGKGLSNQRTPVPNLIGMNLEPARNRILGASLNLRTFIYDNTISSGNDSLKAFVYRQTPEFRKELTLQLGSDIYLWLTIDSAKLPSEVEYSLTDTIPLPVMSVL
jgi:eukaryotic-like serine/threonine-protein kinase